MILTRPLVIFDLETTGLSINTDKIIQIGALKLNLDGTSEKKNILINPGIPIPSNATEIHGITNEMVAGSPTFSQISKSLKEFFKGCDIGGYNSDVFDIPLLIMEFHRCGIEFPDWILNFVDSLKIEKLINSHRLEHTYTRYTCLLYTSPSPRD